MGRKRKLFSSDALISGILFYSLWWLAIVVLLIRDRAIGYREAGFAVAGAALPTLSVLALSGEAAIVRTLSAVGVHCLVGKIILYRYP